MSPDENSPATSPTPDAAPAPDKSTDNEQRDQAGQQHGDGDNVAGGGDVVHGDKIVQAPEDGGTVGDVDIDEVPDDFVTDDDIGFDDPDEGEQRQRRRRVMAATLLPARKVAGYGWQRDQPDPRDHIYNLEERILRDDEAPDAYDLTGEMPPIYNQLQLGSCTANGSCAVLEHAAMAQNEGTNTPSRLFVYYETRRIEGTSETQDSGGQVRDAVRVLVSEGAPPEDRMALLRRQPGAVLREAIRGVLCGRGRTRGARVLKDRDWGRGPDAHRDLLPPSDRVRLLGAGAVRGPQLGSRQHPARLPRPEHAVRRRALHRRGRIRLHAQALPDAGVQDQEFMG